LTKLQHLEILDTQVSPTLVAELQRQMPDCSIRYDSSEFDQANRETAQWALERGGVSDLLVADGTTTRGHSDASLPEESFRVVTLNLDDDEKLTDDDLVRLKPLTRLRSLSLNNTPLCGASLGLVEGLPELAYVSLSGTQVDDAALQALSRATRLRKLWIWRAAITDDGLQHLKSLSQMEHLEMGGNSIVGTGLQHISGLTRLRFLGIGRTQVEDDSLVHLGEMHQLWRLNLSSTPITAAGLEQLKELKGLAIVNMTGAPSVPRGADLQRILPSCNIIHDSIPASDRPDRIAALSLLEQGATVKLQVNWRPIIEVREAADLPDDIVLVTGVAFSGAQSDAAIDLRMLRDRRMLTSVKVDGATPADDAFGNLVACPRLSELHLARLTLTESHVDDLSRLEQLRNLTLDDMQVPREVVDAIRSALPGCHVRILAKPHR
jgi:hypothetical protein